MTLVSLWTGCLVSSGLASHEGGIYRSTRKGREAFITWPSHPDTLTPWPPIHSNLDWEAVNCLSQDAAIESDLDCEEVSWILNLEYCIYYYRIRFRLRGGNQNLDQGSWYLDILISWYLELKAGHTIKKSARICNPHSESSLLKNFSVILGNWSSICESTTADLQGLGLGLGDYL